jgi:hypothetical protein
MKRLGAACAAAMALGAGAGHATEFIETITGTVISGTAGAGLVGPSAVDLTGMGYSADIVFDTTMASSERAYGIYFNYPPASHLLDFSFIVDGVNLTPRNNYTTGAVITADTYFETGAFTARTRFDVQTPPSPTSPVAPFSFSPTSSSAYLDLDPKGSGGLQAQLTADTITLATTAAVFPAVPEPATWALMITGFGLVGSMARRRRFSSHCW